MPDASEMTSERFDTLVGQYDAGKISPTDWIELSTFAAMLALEWVLSHRETVSLLLTEDVFSRARRRHGENAAGLAQDIADDPDEPKVEPVEEPELQPDEEKPLG